MTSLAACSTYCSSREADALKILTNWTRQPNEFVRQMFDVEPEAWQDQALQLVRDYPQTAIRSGHGVGKGAFLCWLIILNMVTLYPVKIGVTAPTSAQLHDNLWSELGKWHRRMRVFGDQFEWNHIRFVLKAAPDQSFATARTASKERPEALQGLRTDNVLLLGDEASGIYDEIFEAAEGTMSQPGARMVLTGNPTRMNGYFHRAFTADRGTWQTMRVSCAESSRVDPSYMDKIRQEYGEHSNAWRIRVLGEFPLQEGGALMALDVIERAIGADRAAEGVHTWGLDVGGTGGDGSTLAKRCGPVLAPIRLWRGLDQMALVGKVKQEWDETPESERPVALNVDATGIGEGAASRLVEVGLPARAIKVGIVIKVPGKKEPIKWFHRYANVRSALIHRTADWIEGASIPQDQELIAELSTVCAGEPNSWGQETIEKKVLIRERLGRSCNHLDAVALTMVTGELGIKGGTKQDRTGWFAARARG